ncbi:NUDIX domain-containing protein [Arthrobacter sp. NPDC057013]|uniref:NUDIX hydrolase n=1 Tax=Arthrobacter sp. NPDC057013 TaxID=3345999 RepID=UPI00363FFC70
MGHISTPKEDAFKNPEPRLAVSVVLVRDSQNGLEVFVQHRASTMDFAAGVVAFPGGRVDAVDSSYGQLSVDLLEAHAAAWERTEASSEAADACHNAGRLIAAAVREVAEECGISVEPLALTPWANWITPKGMPKRFDTYFFVCALAPGVEPRHVTTEASHSHWVSVRQLLEQEAAGLHRLLPPTLTILDELLETGGAEHMHQKRRTIEAVQLRPDEIEEFYRLRRAFRPAPDPEA